MGFTEEATSDCCGDTEYDDFGVCGGCKEHAGFSKQCEVCDDIEGDCKCEKCDLCKESKPCNECIKCEGCKDPVDVRVTHRFQGVIFCQSCADNLK